MPLIPDFARIVDLRWRSLLLLPPNWQSRHCLNATTPPLVENDNHLYQHIHR